MKYGLQSDLLRGKLEASFLKSIRVFGCEGVELDWRSFNAPMGPVSAKDGPALTRAAHQIRTLMRQAGLDAISITPGILPNFADKPDMVKLHFECIGEAGSGMVRMFPPLYVGFLNPANEFQAYYDGRKDFHRLADDFARHLQGLVRLAEAFNLKIIFETHDGFMPQGFSGFYHFLKDHSHQHVGVILDPENMVREGMENWRMGVEMLGKYIACVHCKNMGWERVANPSKDDQQPPQHMKNWKAVRMGLEEGIVDWRQLVFFLRKSGYCGYFVDEDYSSPLLEDKKKNLDHLKVLWANECDPWNEWFNWLKDSQG